MGLFKPTFSISQMSRDQACLGYAMARKRRRKPTFSLSQKTKESSLALAWREKVWNLPQV